MSKWQKIDPDQIKVGDRVKCVDDSTDCVTTHSGIVADLEGGDIVVGINGYIHPLTGTWYIAKPKNTGTWYIAKPKKAKPPTRPDEPPVGSFVRVDRTERAWLRLNEHDYTEATGDITSAWASITEPGDTITRLSLVEATDD